VGLTLKLCLIHQYHLLISGSLNTARSHNSRDSTFTEHNHASSQTVYYQLYTYKDYTYRHLSSASIYLRLSTPKNLLSTISTMATAPQNPGTGIYGTENITVRIHGLRDISRISKQLLADTDLLELSISQSPTQKMKKKTFLTQHIPSYLHPTLTPSQPQKITPQSANNPYPRPPSETNISMKTTSTKK
jgi:hypothetical protein